MHKRILSLILALSLIFSLAAVTGITASAETFGDFEYELLEDDTVMITGYTGYADALEIPSEIDGKKVTTIGDCAFMYSSIKSVTIPDTVTTIWASAFAECTNLESAVIPDTVTTFCGFVFENTALFKNEENWENGALYVGNYLISGKYEVMNEETYESEVITEVEGDYIVKDGTVAIADFAFYGTSCGNHSLTGITIPDSVITIGDSAFSDCSSLTNVTFGSGVANIGGSTFEYCNALTDINVPEDNQTYCDENGILFTKDKTKLVKYPIGKAEESYTIPDGVTTVCDYAFWANSSLKSVTIPDSVTEIRTSAFYNCQALESVKFGNGIKTVDDGAFCSCYSLTDISFPDSIENVGSYVFEGAAIYKNEDNWVDGALYIGSCLVSGKLEIYEEGDEVSKIITEVKGDYQVKDGTRVIAGDAFVFCSSLTGITIPDSVVTIGYKAFASCDSLTSVMLGNGVATIYNNAFWNCKSIKSVTIPKSVRTMTECGLGYYYDEETYNMVQIPNFHIDCYRGTEGARYAMGFDCTFLDGDGSITASENGVDIIADGDAQFPEGTEISVDKVESDSEKYNVALKALDTDRIEVYDITAIKDGETVQPAPDGIVAATFTVPEDFDIYNTMVYYVSDSGEYEPMMCTVDVENRKITAQLTHFSMYVVAEKLDAPQIIYGDVTGDEKVNMLDVLLIRKYIAKQPVQLDTMAADVTCDDKVNMLDVLLIRKYIAKQPVILGPKG